MNIIKETSTVNTTIKKNRDIKFIVIHYTAGVTSKSGTAKSTAKYFAKETTKASADYIIDDEYIVQYNPDIKNTYCWHAGGTKYKTKGGSFYKVATSVNSIGIELCSRNDTNKVTNANDKHWSFSDKVINNAIELVKYLMKEYNIDNEHVIRHYDVNGKPCPGIIGWNADTNDEKEWFDFKSKLIEKELKEEKNEVKQDKTKVEKTTITVGEVIDNIEALDREEYIENKEENIKKLSLIEIIIDLLKKIFKK